MQPLSVLAYAAANAWEVLARVESVDSTRIGIMGHSSVLNGLCLLLVYMKSLPAPPGVVNSRVIERVSLIFGGLSSS